MKCKLILSSFLVGMSIMSMAQTPERLIANSYKTHDGTLFVEYDSTTYNYVGNRGIALNRQYLINAIKGNTLLVFTIPCDTENKYLYNTSTTTYDHTQRTTNTYNAEGKLTMTRRENFDVPSSSWINSRKIEYIYDSNGNQTSKEEQDWNAS